MKKVEFDDDSNDFSRLAKNKLEPEFLPKHQQKWQVFKYEEPILNPPRKRALVRLSTTDLALAQIQKVEEGGESRLHSHSGQDGFFFVLKGNAVFSGDEGEEYRLGPMEGVTIPRGVLYSFRKSGEESLILLQVESFHPGVKANTYRKGGAEDSVPPSQSIDLYDAKLDK